MFRINLLFILTMFLSACGVKAAPTQTAEIPPTEAPIVIPTNDVVLPKQPVGVGLAPGSEVVQSSTADSQVSQDYFVPPTIPDAKRVFGGEAPVPEQISAEVAAFKAEADKILAEVESDCVVDDGSLRTVYHEGSVPGVDNLNNWFFTYEGTFEGEPVVCWATKISDGKMGEFPIYYEQGSKRVMSLADGVMWQRTPKGTTADLAGTTPVLISKTEFIVPEGLTGSDIHNEAKWTALEAAPVVESAPVANPFTPDQMARLDETGYTYNASGELVNAYGNVAISNRDGKWVDGGGNEFSFDSFKIIETNGVTFEDLPLNIVSFDVGGEQRFSLPSGESAKPIDLSSGRDLVDKNAKTNPTAYSWGTYTELTFDQIPVITQEDVDSGLLFFSRENNLRPWSSDVIVPVWKYMSGNTEAGVWYLTQYKTGSFEIGSHNKASISDERPVVWKNDAGFVPTDVVRYQDEFGNWITDTGYQMYYGEGDSLVMSVKSTGNHSGPKNYWTLFQKSTTYPMWVVLLPIVTHTEFTQYLPPDLLARIGELEGKPQVDIDVAGIWLAGSELPHIQEHALELGVEVGYRVRQMEKYLAEEHSPDFDPPSP